MVSNEQEQFATLLSRQQIKSADAIVLLAGDRFYRLEKAVELYRKGYAPYIVLTSNADDWDYGSLPSHILVRKLLELGVPESHIIWEETARHTREEADSTLRIAKEKGWDTLILVTTRYHQYRAFLTWHRAMNDACVDLDLIVSPVQGFPDFYNETEDQAIEREFAKIKQYGEKGDVASYESGIEYLSKRIQPI